MYEQVNERGKVMVEAGLHDSLYTWTVVELISAWSSGAGLD